MMKIAVCDDNATERSDIERYIKKYCIRNFYWCKTSTFASGEELLTDFSAGTFPIIFLDVYMPGMTGVGAARKIRETDPNCVIVFITVSEDHAPDAFSVHSRDYLVKPIESEKMNTALHYCREQFEKDSRSLRVHRTGQQYIDINICRIQYVEVSGRETVFHVNGKEINTLIPLREPEDQLSGGSFLRSCRSAIVNMNYVETVKGQEFIMQDGGRVPISRRKLVQIKTDYTQYLAGGDIGGWQS